MFNFRSIKTQFIVYLTALAIFLAFRDKEIGFLTALLIAVISSLAVETLLKYLFTKSFQISESSIITGLIVGFVLSSDEVLWKIALASVIAILSKYLIRFKHKHIFNPAALGIFLVILLFNASTQWMGTYLWYILVPFGIYFIFKIKKIEIIISYGIVALALFGFQAIAQKASLGNIFGYLSYFFIFVMMIEPLTTPVNFNGKIIFGAGIAGLIFMLTWSGLRFDAELFSLLAMNATVPLLNKLTKEREKI